MQDAIIPFTEQEIAEIHRIAFLRQRTKERPGTRDYGKISEKDSITVHAEGFAAEYALAKYLGVEPDRSIGPAGHKGTSLIVNGFKINIYHSRLTWGGLLYLPNKVPKVDVLVLANRELPAISLSGWIDRTTFLAQYTETWIKNRGIRWFMEQRELNPIITLKRRLGLEDAVEDTMHQEAAVQQMALL